MTTRARRMLLCASGGYQCHTLPGFVLALLRHFADDVQVVLSRAASPQAFMPNGSPAAINALHNSSERSG